MILHLHTLSNIIDNTVLNHLACVGSTLLASTHKNDAQPATLTITTLRRSEPTWAESVTTAANISTDGVLVVKTEGTCHRQYRAMGHMNGEDQDHVSAKQCVHYQTAQSCLLAKFGS